MSRSRRANVALALLAVGLAAGCADDDAMTSEARDAYAHLTAEPLWTAVPPGDTLLDETTAGCRTQPHSTTFHEPSLPERVIDVPDGSDWRAPVRWYAAEARRDGWTVGPAVSSSDDEGGPVTDLEVVLRRTVDGRPSRITVRVSAGPTLFLTGEVDGVDPCPPGTR